MTSAFAYPAPAISVEYSYETLLGQRVNDFVAQWDVFRARNPALDLPQYNVESLETDPAIIALQSSACGDMYFVAYGNDLSRATVLVDFATGADLDLHGAETRVPAHPDGVARHPGERDADYRARIIEARSGSSAAGPDEWWLTHARAADPRVRSIGIDYRGMGDLRIYLLSRDNGGVPDRAMLDAVTARLTRQDVRPRTAWPVVSSAIVDEVDVVADVTLLPDTPQDRIVAIKAAALAAHGAAQSLDQDLTHHYLRRILDAPDVYGIRIIAPAADLVADPERAYAIRSIDLRFAGYQR